MVDGKVLITQDQTDASEALSRMHRLMQQRGLAVGWCVLVKHGGERILMLA